MSNDEAQGPTRASAWAHTGYAQKIHFGAGLLEKLPEIVKGVGAQRVMLVTTERRLASGEGERIVKALGRTLVSVFAGVRPHVPASAVQSAVGQAQAEQVDGLVSFGGGSCADAGKAVCFFVEQQAGTPGISYLDRPALKHVAVPTAYSGAELTPFFGMTDEATKRKTGAGGPTTAPVAVLYDPVLTVGTPARVSAETGMNCLAHGVECAYSPFRSPEAEAIALACVREVGANLPLVVDDPSDLAARTAMLVGACLGGRCLQNAGMGAHHGLAQLLGGRTGMPHGLANALLLSRVMRFNASAVPQELERVGAALGDRADPAGAVDRLREQLGLPAHLEACGVTAEDLDAVVRLSQGSPSVRANPAPVSEADARSILEAAW